MPSNTDDSSIIDLNRLVSEDKEAYGLVIKSEVSAKEKRLESEIKDRQVERTSAIAKLFVVSIAFLAVIFTCLYFLIFSEDNKQREWAQTIIGPIVGVMSGFFIGKQQKDGTGI